MNHRPYPNAGRAYHQLARHADETPPRAEPRPLSPMEQTLVDYARAAVQSAAPALATLVRAMRPASSEETA
ncbi:hypothetical protein [Streptomyces spinosisporus]|uniref:Uncharacterized protein n=1 Tax=Streptomyces spinosisporus TaxID=2927582 RepID=A0ABS9XWA1_9ACTN|nr:hypothetical protein [Streptomyces spinosisporus]MCI3246331.1 hypothetical protein [Streptomyces spinosisporus]